MAQLEDVQIASPAFKANPHPFYARLRQSSPVCRVMLPSKQEAWLVARYDDVATLLKDSRFAKDRHNAMTPEQLARQPWVPSVFAPLMRNMLDRDDPDHARLRKLVHKAFTVRRVEMITERTQALSDELLDKVRGRGTFDLIDDFALPLPIIIISEMLGVPEGDRAKFARWSKTMIKNTMSPLSVLLTLPSMLSFIRYVRELVKQKRAAPQDDLVSALVQAEDAGEQLTADELLAMIVLLLTAGHETTVNLIGNGMLALLQNTEQLERLRKEPTLIETAVEELLRFSSPVETTTNRYAREELTIADSSIPRGALVLGIIASANRDDRHFREPQTLDVARDPNKHLTFGQGGHYCVGAPLARMEGKIAISTLLRRFPDLRLGCPVDQLKWRRGLVLRGLLALPLAIR